MQRRAHEGADGPSRACPRLSTGGLRWDRCDSCTMGHHDRVASCRARHRADSDRRATTHRDHEGQPTQCRLAWPSQCLSAVSVQVAVPGPRTSRRRATVPTSVVPSCARCGWLNPVDFRFCVECGSPRIHEPTEVDPIGDTHSQPCQRFGRRRPDGCVRPQFVPLGRAYPGPQRTPARPPVIGRCCGRSLRRLRCCAAVYGFANRDRASAGQSAPTSPRPIRSCRRATKRSSP